MVLLTVLTGVAVYGIRAFHVWRQERAKRHLARQLRESMQCLAHALRVGAGFLQALEYTAMQGAKPLAGEWRRILQAVQLGRPLGQALDDFVNVVPIREAAWFSAAVQVTQSAGGSLADVLETLAATLQERETLREKIEALTAQGKASGILLSLLPFLLMGAVFVVAPDLERPLFTTSAGRNVIAGVILSIAVGGAVIKKIVTIPVD